MKQESPPSRYSISYADFAAKVLQNHAAGTRMDCRAIAKEAVARGWLEARDRFGIENISVHISIEIAKQESQGLTPRFTAHGDGVFSLSSKEATNPPPAKKCTE